jgi:ATP-dependent helicase/nuclease subunit B
MAIRFILGRAGTGKTRWCFDQIVHACADDPLGPVIWWIVPKQMTFLAERMLACQSGLRAICRARVVSFERFAEHVIEEAGGGAVPRVTPLGRQMIIGHLLRTQETQLRYFRATARQTGLAAELDRTFAELERCGFDGASLDPMIQQVEQSTSDLAVTESLADKLRDVQVLYRQYQDFLGQDRLDPHRRLVQVLGCLGRCPSLRGARVYVDSFFEFTEFERRLLAGLARACERVEVTLLIDPRSPIIDADPSAAEPCDELGCFHRSERTYRGLLRTLLKGAVFPEEPVRLETTHRFGNGWIGVLEKSWTQQRPGVASRHDGIRLLHADDRRDEVHAAARQIRRLIAEGVRFRDIAVLARDIDAYADLVTASFAEHGIPLFIDRRRSAEHHPLMQLVRGLTRVATQDWPLESVLAIARSGLCGLSLEDADDLENYYLEHRLRPAAWEQPAPWSYCRRASRRGHDADESDLPSVLIEATRMDELRRSLVDRSRPIVRALAGLKPQPLRHFVKSLVGTLERMQVRRTLAGWIQQAETQSRFEERDEHLQVWTEFTELLDQMVDLLGEQMVTARDFVTILDFGLEQFDLAITPPTVDQVLVGDIDRTRLGAVRAVVLLGLNEGQFPRTPAESTVFSDTERGLLDAGGLPLEPDSTRRLLDEAFLAYLAFTRPSERLILCRATSDEAGRATTPSVFLRRVLAMFPTLTSEPTSPAVGTPRQVLTRVMRWVRSPAAADPASAAGFEAALYQHLATAADATSPLVRLRDRAWKALSYDTRATLDADVAGRLFPAPLKTSVSRIESFATCPFRHFVQYGLRLQVREEQEVTVLDLGNVCHGALERIVRKVLKERIDWVDLTVGLDDAVESLTEEAARVLREEIMLSDARGRYLLERMKGMIRDVVHSQRTFHSYGDARPIGVELNFDDRGDLPPLAIPTPLGEIVLRGKIDRLDLIDDGLAFSVIDYKLSGRSLSLEQVYHGLALQLLAYLVVVRAARQVAGVVLSDPRPAAALYVPLLRKIERVAHPSDGPDPDQPAFALEPKPSGVVAVSQIEKLDHHFETRSEVLNFTRFNNGSLRGDAVPDEHLDVLLQWVQAQVAMLGEQILRGVIDVKPFYDKQGKTPCGTCDFQAVCRFEPAAGPYRHLRAVPKKEAVDLMLELLGNEARS